jgi:hypothetical protein
MSFGAATPLRLLKDRRKLEEINRNWENLGDDRPQPILQNSL